MNRFKAILHLLFSKDYMLITGDCTSSLPYVMHENAKCSWKMWLYQDMTHSIGAAYLQQECLELEQEKVVAQAKQIIGG